MNRGTKQLFPGAGPSVRALASFAMTLDVVDSVSVDWDGVRVSITKVREPEAVWGDLDAVWKASQRLYNRQLVSPMTAAPELPDDDAHDHSHDHSHDGSGADCSTCDSGTCDCGPCLEKRLASATAAASVCDPDTCDCDPCLEKRLQKQLGLLN